MERSATPCATGRIGAAFCVAGGVGESGWYLGTPPQAPHYRKAEARGWGVQTGWPTHVSAPGSMRSQRAGPGPGRPSRALRLARGLLSCLLSGVEFHVAKILASGLVLAF